MSKPASYQQLQMVWPEQRLSAPPTVSRAAGYRMRTYRWGDEAGFYQLMNSVGWPGSNEEV